MFRCGGRGVWEDWVQVKKRVKINTKPVSYEYRIATYSKLEYELVKLRSGSRLKSLTASELARVEELETLLPERFSGMSDGQLEQHALEWIQRLKSEGRSRI